MSQTESSALLLPLEIYGTFGPDCRETELLARMLECGMNGIRLNLSHCTLLEKQDWIDNLRQACQQTGRSCRIAIDLQGREMRLGAFQAFEAEEGSLLHIPNDLPVSDDVLKAIHPGDELVIGDGFLHLQVLSLQHDSYICEVLEGGLFEPGKSLRIKGRTSVMPVLSSQDMANLKIAASCGITDLMVPFVQSSKDLQAIRAAVDLWLPNARLLAKIESMEGVRRLDEIMEEADMIVIARGDLAASCSIEWLPAIQDYIEAACKARQKPYMVVTQMLDSMRTSFSPTRPEACDVYQAVLQGAGAIMLTGETASSRYPLQAMQTFCTLAHHAKKIQNDPEYIHTLIRTLG